MKLKVRSYFSQWIHAYIILHNRFYSKACKDNSQVKEKVKLQCKKSEAGLLMENSHLFRTRVENSKLLSRAKRLEDCHSGEQLVCLLSWLPLGWNLEMPSISLIMHMPKLLTKCLNTTYFTLIAFAYLWQRVAQYQHSKRI